MKYSKCYIFSHKGYSHIEKCFQKDRRICHNVFLWKSWHEVIWPFWFRQKSVILHRNLVCLRLLWVYSIYSLPRGLAPATHAVMTLFWFDMVGRIILSRVTLQQWGQVVFSACCSPYLSLSHSNAVGIYHPGLAFSQTLCIKGDCVVVLPKHGFQDSVTCELILLLFERSNSSWRQYSGKADNKS